MTASEFGALSNAWFRRYHLGNLSDAFVQWWIGHYGMPSDYTEDSGEQDEYWTRCAFALTGWNAALSAREA